MTTIAIHRCVLRIRRIGGWSWGTDPDGLIRAATAALPRLIAERLRVDDAVAAGGGTIDAPVRLRVVASVEELAELAAGRGARIANELERQLATAIAASSVRHDEPVHARVDARGETPRAAGGGDASVAATIESAATGAPERRLLEMLAAWHRDGVVAEIAAALPREIIERWAAIIVRAGRAADLLVEPAAEPTAAARAALADGRGDAPMALRYVLAAAAAAATAAPAHPLAPHLIAAVAMRVLAPELHPAQPPDAMATEAAVAAPVASAAGAASVEPLVRAASVARLDPAAVGQAQIVSALPFLALVPLVRCRWLAAVAELLSPSDAAALIAAVAYKTLDPPEHGWRRSPRARAAAAALCGEPLDDAWLHAATTRIAPLAEALVAPLRAELRRGHTRGAPLLLYRDCERHVLFDTSGMFVIAVSRDLAATVAAAQGLGDPVLVPAATATSALLDRLELANLVFVTDAAPGRGEPWRAVPGARLWTNDGAADLARRAQLAPLLASSVALAAELLAAFAARPALPRDDGALDLVATHAAAIALADLAFTLFAAREPATPVLALERFASLDARVTVDPDRVAVAIPLGRRHADLLAHGYLTTIADLPWLGGRVLEIHGG